MFIRSVDLLTSEVPLDASVAADHCTGRVDRVAVVIPACDEASTIVPALDSVRRAFAELSATVATTCVVVADACVDDTAAVARRWSARADMPCVVVECSERSVGAARALGTATAIREACSLGVSPRALWLAHTDADTVVGADWLTRQLALASHGVDGVAGIVELDDAAPIALADRFRRYYGVNTDGTHTHVHGANISMRASTYLRAGGWDARPTGEDHDLWHRLRDVGNCVSSTAIAVRTSARLHGRAPNGFAGDVRALAFPEVVA